MGSPYYEATQHYLQSPEGKGALDIGILRSPELAQYLENRLKDAFAAGWGGGIGFAMRQLEDDLCDECRERLNSDE